MTLLKKQTTLKLRMKRMMKNFIFFSCIILSYYTDSLFALENLEFKIKDLIYQNSTYNLQELEISYPKNKLDFYHENITHIELLDLDENNRTAKLKIFLSDNNIKFLNIYYDGWLDIIISDKFLRVGHVLSSSDFKTAHIKISRVGNEFLKSNKSNNIVNMRLKKNISKNKIIKPSDLAEAFLINMNDIVYVIYHHASLNLKMKALALSSGALGDYIKVQNTSSSSTLYGKILNNKTILVD